MTEQDFNEVVESRLEAEVERLIHSFRAEVTEEMAGLYVKAFKKATGREVTYGEEGFGELGPQDFTPDVVSSAWTEHLIEAAKDVQDELQGEFNFRVGQAIRDFKNDRVNDLRQEVRDEIHA